MAAQQTVESTAEEILQREEHLVVTDHADHLAKVARESHSERDLKEEALARVVKEDHHSARERASVTDHADLSVKVAKDVHSVKDLKEEVSARVVKEDHQEASVTESQQVQDSIQAARASTERTSISSAMRSRAESTR